MIKNFIIRLMAFLLLGNLLFSSVGNHLLFKWMGSKIKSEIKSRLIFGEFYKKFELISFDYDEFMNLEWENPSEFINETGIYDVISIDFSIDKVNILCYLDIKETVFRSNYFNYFKKFTQKESNTKSLLFNFIDFIYSKYINKSIQFEIVFTFNILKAINISFNNIEMYYSPNSPPPNFQFSK